MLDLQQSIAKVVLEHSECASVFQRHRIDFCCRGELTVEAAAQGKGLDPKVLLAELSETITGRQEAPKVDPRELETPELVQHIVKSHHDYLRTALPFVNGLAAKVSRVHGDKNPKLLDLKVAVEELNASLLPHLDDEEKNLFPMLTSTDRDAAAVKNLIGGMEKEHLEVGALLERIGDACDNYTLPTWACTSYRTLFAELKHIESDVFTHVHLENHVLTPRFAT